MNLQADDIFWLHFSRPSWTFWSLDFRGEIDIWAIIYRKLEKNSCMEQLWPIREFKGFLSSWETAAFIISRKECWALTSVYKILSEISTSWMSMEISFWSPSISFWFPVIILLTFSWIYLNVLSSFSFSNITLNTFCLKKSGVYFISSLRENSYWADGSYDLLSS